MLAMAGATPATAAAQTVLQTSIVKTPTCVSCNVKITRVGYLPGNGELGISAGSSDLVALDDSVIVALPGWLKDGEAGWRLVSTKGRIIARYSRKGEGPGEFSNPSQVAGIFSDTIAIYDRSLARLSFFTLSGDFIRSTRTPVGAASYLWLDWIGDGLGVAVGRFQAGTDRGLAGALPFHIVKGDSIIRSFGPVIRKLDPRNPFQFERMILSTGQGLVALQHANEYQLQLYSYAGDVVATIDREVDWFPRTDRFIVGSMDEPPSPIIYDAWVDGRRRLWVLVSQAAKTWRQAFAKKPQRAEGGREVYPIEHEGLYYEGVVEVFDLDSRKLLVSQPLPFPGKYALGRGIVAAQDFKADDGVSLILYKMELEGDRE